MSVRAPVPAPSSEGESVEVCAAELRLAAMTKVRGKSTEFGTLDERTLHQPQGPRSGLAAIFGQLPDDDSGEEIIEALDRLS